MESYDLYHRCRWCKNFQHGKCLIVDEIFDVPDIDELYEYNWSEGIRNILEEHLDDIAMSYRKDETDSVLTEIVEEIGAYLKKDMTLNEGLEVKNASTNDHFCKRFE